MTRTRIAVLTAGMAYAVTLACAWLLLPSRVTVALGDSSWVVDRYQYVVGAGIGAWALAAAGARTWFGRSPKRIETLTATGGGLMIGLGGILLFTGNKH